MKRANRFLPRPFVALLVVALGAVTLAQGAGPEEVFRHDDWARVLEQFVDQKGLVDYAALARDPADLDRYVERVGEMGPRTHPELFPDDDHRLAYYINAYNALVFRGVLDRGPEKTSVWRGLISGFSFFVRMKVRIEGRETNLKTLEDDLIREGFRDPRVHAALNCASLGCPRLPREPFLGVRLDEQLDREMRFFVSETRNVKVDRTRGSVMLSEIFDWFEDDFLDEERRRGNRDPRVIDFVNRFREKGARIPRDFKVSFIHYDKRINAR